MGRHARLRRTPEIPCGSRTPRLRSGPRPLRLLSPPLAPPTAPDPSDRSPPTPRAPSSGDVSCTAPFREGLAFPISLSVKTRRVLERPSQLAEQPRPSHPPIASNRIGGHVENLRGLFDGQTGE